MHLTPPVARPGDICLLLEPAHRAVPSLRRLQEELQANYGGTLQQRIHFTYQRFALPDPSQLLRVVDALQTNLAPIPPFPVHAQRLELVEHPFWEFCVLRWDLRRSTPMWNFARTVHYALRQADMAPHYPCNDDWRPHVTALEAISSPDDIYVNGHHRGQHLYTARRVTLSQVQEGKQFQILASIELKDLATKLR